MGSVRSIAMATSCKMLLLCFLVLAEAGPMEGPDTRQSCTDYSNTCDSWQICCDGKCIDLGDDCLGVSGHTILGLGIAAAVASIAIPILCCCCCAGCAAYWIMKRRKQRRGFQGNINQPGMHHMVPAQGQVHMVPGQGQFNQPGMNAWPGQGQVQQSGGFVMPNQGNTDQKPF